MNHVLTESEYLYARRLKERGVIKSIVPKQLTCLSNGVILLQCPDCDQRQGWRAYIETLCTLHNGSPRVHAINLHAGAAVIPTGSPASFRNQESRVMLRQTAEAIQLKGLRAILSTVHWRCGKLASSGVTLSGAMKLAVQAAEILKRKHPDVTVLNAISLNYGEYDHRVKQGIKTYLIP